MNTTVPIQVFLGSGTTFHWGVLIFYIQDDEITVSDWWTGGVVEGFNGTIKMLFK